MANVKSMPAFLSTLRAALTKGLKAAGISAKIESEPIPGTKLHRVLVLAPKFKSLKPSERQDLVWRIADQVLTQEEQLRISMMLTMTPDEASGAE